MPDREIEPGQWKDFFDSFSRAHEGWLVTIEVFGSLGAQPEARQLPLRGVTAEAEGPGGSISILVGSPEETLTHMVRRPSRVRLEQTEEGADASLQIESEKGETTLLRFRSAILPQMVDGMLPR